MPAPFLETPRFPDDLAIWAVGGRGFQTTIVRAFTGQESRNVDMAYGGNGAWDVSACLRTPDWQSNNYNQKTLRNYFMVAHGAAYGFRLKDFQDYKDESSGILGLTGLGVAATTSYQMYKGYSMSPLSALGIILKPVAATIAVYVNGVLKTLTTDYTLDSTTGIVTFTSQPTVGHTLTWTGQYDIPVRFQSDNMEMGLDSTGALYEWHGLKLIELVNL
jgi:uncharacterized protein (TIGR02217 family)